MIVSSFHLSIEYVNVKFEIFYKKVSEYDQEISHKKNCRPTRKQPIIGLYLESEARFKEYNEGI